MSGFSQWEPDYPTRGIDFYIWKQTQEKGDTQCQGGIFIESSNLCFRYKVMTQVCVFLKMRHDPELNQYSWFYTGGCFKGGEPVNYEDLRPGEVKTFKDVQFEVRLDHREWDEIANSEQFTAEMDEIKDLEQETEQEKKVRLKKETTHKVDKIENKSEQNAGMYSVYQFFLAASILSFLLGVVCIALLIYYYVQANNSEENQPLTGQYPREVGGYGNEGYPTGLGYNGRSGPGGLA